MQDTVTITIHTLQISHGGGNFAGAQKQEAARGQRGTQVT
jgi:hypothetical protein